MEKNSERVDAGMSFVDQEQYSLQVEVENNSAICRFRDSKGIIVHEVRVSTSWLVSIEERNEALANPNEGVGAWPLWRDSL